MLETDSSPLGSNHGKRLKCELDDGDSDFCGDRSQVVGAVLKQLGNVLLHVILEFTRFSNISSFGFGENASRVEE